VRSSNVRSVGLVRLVKVAQIDEPYGTDEPMTPRI
jgi:hypothetical protein